MKHRLFNWGLASCLSALSHTLALASGDEVVVVYNSRLPESKSLAEYYAKQRDVPKGQVFGFALTTDEAISRTEFRNELQEPLAKKITSAKLWRRGPAEINGTNGKPVRIESKVLESKIRYAVLCYGVPLKILNDENYREPGDESLRVELRRNGAAVDSELAWLPVIDQKPALAGPLRNPVHTTTNVALLHPTNGILLVTRLDGPTPEIARGLVDKALQAENDGLWGRAYFDLRNTTDAGMKQGDDWIRGAAEIARHIGFETVVDENWDVFPAGYPMSHIAFYAGWYREHVAGPFALPRVEIMPGAFAYHLHSYSAASLRVTDRHWAGPLLAKGVTCTMGCVDEPYLGATPDMGVFTGRFMFYGFTFGEAAYAGQPALSWQTTVVGDPLYRPFGRNPDLLHKKLIEEHNQLIEWSWLRLANRNVANGRSVAEAVLLLENLDATKQSAVLKEKLADLYSAQGKPSSAALTYQQALKLNPSPQQRIRLRLALGEKLVALNHSDDAYVNYQKLLEESPDYADTLSIYRKLLPLAQKLGKTEDAAEYEAKVNPTNAAPATKMQ